MTVNYPIIEQSDEKILEIVQQLQVAYKLKRTLRYSTKRDMNEHSESVAEHVFALWFLAQYFLPLEDPKRQLNVEKLFQILLFHDFAEVVHGDIPYHQKTEVDEKHERAAAKIVFESLPAPLGETAYKRWKEFEQKQSPESRFAQALDKIEPIFEMLDPVNSQSMKRLKFSYKDHIGKKTRATEGFPVMRKFLEVVTKEMLRRDIFWKDVHVLHQV
ncbi:MAG: HD domain-containing protein [bacterium]|nr:HD domain-containing protein [bacterium]